MNNISFLLTLLEIPKMPQEPAPMAGGLSGVLLSATAVLSEAPLLPVHALFRVENENSGTTSLFTGWPCSL